LTSEIVDAGKQMLAFGFEAEAVNELLRDAGNLAAGMGKEIDMIAGAFGRIRAGDFGEAMEVLRRAGISKEALTLQGLEFSDGGEFEGSWQEMLAGVQAVIKDRFPDMMNEMAGTFDGLVSTLKSKWELFKISVGEAGFLENVKTVLKNILALIEKWKTEGKLEEWAKSISDYMSRTLNGVTAIIEKITGVDLSSKVKKDFMDWELGGKTFRLDMEKYVGAEPQEKIMEALGLSEREMTDVATYWRDGLTDAFLETAEGSKVISEAMRVEAYLAAEETKRAFDMLHDNGGDSEIPFWAQAIISAIDRIKEEFTNLQSIFSDEGWEGIANELTTRITQTLKGVNWGEVIKSILEYRAEIEATGKEVGKAMADGIRTALEEEMPRIADVLKVIDFISDINLPWSPGMIKDVANTAVWAGEHFTKTQVDQNLSVQFSE